MKRLAVFLASTASIVGGALMVLFWLLARSYSAPCAADFCVYPGEGTITAIGIALVGFGLVGFIGSLRRPIQTPRPRDIR